ncbi:thioredoxin domain-containing protein [Nocardioides sp. B-3]|uniref:thioredoxin domain-containing protein n=1 Tax=Nocardioides sp. B-3 TaxID=2895565 RepID=UPI0021539E99|nr:thioredoxin domain-containing protein [Nocardioides sp. B-3]UUZ60283.1 thioredoxin domain-containing protein [Nocardioides sp. B-3]
MANRLASATSPYLLQHASNPVDWWEWGPEAFAEAKRRDAPILLSVGYSACHWCHVMAHESFEDETTAAYLNEHYVSIKVDREERPDVDAIYMQATTAMTGHGGWPMTCVLDHEGNPFFAGTYFPPRPAHGQPSFTQVLQGLSDAWVNRGHDVARVVGNLREHLNAQAALPAGLVDRAVLDGAVNKLRSEFDTANGGFGGAPKFPPSMVLEFPVRHGSDDALAMVDDTLEAMARGGIHDQLGGGFARYSVDAQWVVPHFEKMLYDNALLLRVCADRRTPMAAWAGEGIADFLIRELRTDEGGFASALDADSEGVEGKFYARTPAQLVGALGEEDGRWAASLFEVTDTGTFEHGASTLQLLRDADDTDRWIAVRDRLLVARSERVRPERDDKVVAARNGLAISGPARLAAWLDEPRYLDAAVAAGELLLELHVVDGRLRRVSRDGVVGTPAGVLEDHGAVAAGFLDLLRATGDSRWLHAATDLLDTALAHFPR